MVKALLHAASRSVLIVLILFQDGVNGARETMSGSEKKAKRHLEREGLDTERRGKDKKHSHKRQKMNKTNLQRRQTSTSTSPRSDYSQSDDSDEEMAVCPAERCQLPEGDEVRKTSVKALKHRFRRGQFTFHKREPLCKNRIYMSPNL